MSNGAEIEISQNVKAHQSDVGKTPVKVRYRSQEDELSADVVHSQVFTLTFRLNRE